MGVVPCFFRTRFPVRVFLLVFLAHGFLFVFSCSRFLARSSRSSLRLSMSFCSHVCPRALTFTRICLWVRRDISGYMMRAWCTQCASRKYVRMDAERCCAGGGFLSRLSNGANVFFVHDGSVLARWYDCGEVGCRCIEYRSVRSLVVSFLASFLAWWLRLRFCVSKWIRCIRCISCMRFIRRLRVLGSGRRGV